MKLLSAILLFLVAVLARICAVEEDEGVLVLTEDNFQEVLAENKHVFVMFYAQWCSYSNEFSPEFVRLGEKLAAMNVPIKLGKVDEHGQRKLLLQNGVTRLPTLKLFSEQNRFPVKTDGHRHWNAVEYDGDETVNDMIGWLLNEIL